MKAHYRTRDGRVTIEVEGESIKDVFKKIASVQEAFEADADCGCCKSTSLRLKHRVAGEFDFYEMACLDCNARLQLGQTKVGGNLFPKRKDDTGNWLPDRGWAKWVGTKERGR